MERKPLSEVLDEHGPGLMALPGVVGVGIGETGGLPCIRVFVVERTPVLESSIPPTLHGYPVALEETGEFRARNR